MTNGAAALDFEKIKQGQRAVWTAGDFGVIARTIARSGEHLAAEAKVQTGERALDVACGTGNVALPLARAGAVVTGVDIAPNLLSQARERAAAAGLAIHFDEGDAEQLPYADGAFDIVTSMFGAMFAPRPERVVQEFARVLRPGGRLLMANWNPESFSGRMFTLSARHVPPPAGLPAPVQWGEERTVRARLESSFGEIETQLIPIDFDLPEAPAGVVDFFARYFGPTQVAMQRLDEPERIAFRDDMVQLWSNANVAAHPAHHTLVRNQYLQVRAIRS